MSTSRPVAVLLGWLGCQPRNLRRFAQLYDNRGWDTTVHIASPESVIAAIQQAPCCKQATSQISLQTDDLTTELYHQTLDILNELQSRQCPQFILHIFSNGGCFLWEWITHILIEGHQFITWKDYSINTQNLRSRLVGCVFDSSPANYEGRPHGIVSALQHISPPSEKARLINMAKKVDSSTVMKRHNEFWNNMCNHRRLSVPELYLYSENDRLTPYKPLQKLIDKRKEVLGEENIWVCDFIDSDHCGHLLKYPKQYDSILRQFIAACSRGRIVSKL